MAGKLTKAKQDKIVKEAYAAADSYFTSFKDNIDRYRSQLKFWISIRDQWDEPQKATISSFNQIPLACPKIYGIARRMIGEQRQSTPDIKVSALTEKATPEDLKLRDDYVRTACFHSDAHVAYQTAYRCTMFGGFGAWKMFPKYENSNTFNQYMALAKVDDPTLCFWDIAAKDPSKGDGDHCGEYFTMPTKRFESKYPGIDVTTYDALPNCGYVMSDKDSVGIIIYQRKEYFNKTILQMESGEVIQEKEYEKKVNEYVAMQKEIAEVSGVPFDPETMEIPESLRPTNKKRVARDYKIRTYKIAGKQVLEHFTWPAKELGYIFIDGDSSWVNGKQVTKPFFEDAQDLQKAGNYLFTKITHLIRTMRSEQWLVTPENITGYEAMWQNPELQQGALIANPDNNGMMPIQLQPGSISMALIQQYETLMQNINTTLGIYEAYEGNNGREISGVAHENRVKQGNLATFILNSNLNRGVAQTGKVFLSAFPRLYDTQRPITLTSRDGETRTIILNKSDGGQILNDTSGDDYYIEMDAGSSFEGQKKESLDALRELLQINPGISQLTADLFAENLPLQNAQVLVRRLRAALVPPEVVAAGNGEEMPPKEPEPPPPEVEYMMQDIKLRRERQQQEAALKQEKLDLEREKQEFDAYVQEEKLNLEAAKIGIYER